MRHFRSERGTGAEYFFPVPSNNPRSLFEVCPVSSHFLSGEFKVDARYCTDKFNNNTSLFIKSLKCGLTFKCKMKATELYFGVLLSIMLYTLFLTFESVDHKNRKGCPV